MITVAFKCGLRLRTGGRTALEDTAAVSSKAFEEILMFAVYQADWGSEAAAIRALNALPSTAT